MSEGLKAKLIPKICKEGGDFEGDVIIKMPSFLQRMNFLKEQNINVDENGMIDLKSVSIVGVLTDAIAQMKDNIVSVNIKHKESGYEIRDYQSLSTFPGADSVLTELANKYLSGFELGNELKLI